MDKNVYNMLRTQKREGVLKTNKGIPSIQVNGNGLMNLNETLDGYKHIIILTNYYTSSQKCLQ